MFDNYSDSDLRNYLALEGYDLGTKNAKYNTIEDLRIAAHIDFVASLVNRESNKGSDLIESAVQKLRYVLRHGKSVFPDPFGLDDEYEFF